MTSNMNKSKVIKSIVIFLKSKMSLWQILKTEVIVLGVCRAAWRSEKQLFYTNIYVALKHLNKSLLSSQSTGRNLDLNWFKVIFPP